MKTLLIAAYRYITWIFPKILIILNSFKIPFDQHIIRHNYSASTKKNDIALVKFFGAIEFTDFIRPACIRLATEDTPEYENLVIAGWGSIEAESELLFWNIYLSSK